MKRIFQPLLSIFVLSLFAVGCSNPLGGEISQVDQNYGPKPQFIPAATGFENVSGARVNGTSANQTHKTDLTVGASANQIRVVTTGNKVLYLTVQGQMISR